MTPWEVAAFTAEMDRLRPSDVKRDPELHTQIERLAEVVDGLCWELTDGAPRFRAGRLVRGGAR